MSRPSYQQNDLQICSDIEEWYKSDRVLLLMKGRQPEGRHQVCIELHENCSEERLKAMCLPSAQSFFRKMKAAHCKDNSTGFAFSESYGQKCEREGEIYKKLKEQNFEFSNMPQNQGCALKIWSFANDNQADVVQLWRDTLKLAGNNAEMAKKCHVEDAIRYATLRNKNEDEIAKRVASEKKKMEDEKKKMEDYKKKTQEVYQNFCAEEKKKLAEVNKKLAEEKKKLSEVNKKLAEEKKKMRRNLKTLVLIRITELLMIRYV